MMKKGDALGVPTIKDKPPLYDRLNSGGDGRLTRHRCGHPRRGRRVPSGPRPPNAQRAPERIPGSAYFHFFSRKSVSNVSGRRSGPVPKECLKKSVRWAATSERDAFNFDPQFFTAEHTSNTQLLICDTL